MRLRKKQCPHHASGRIYSDKSTSSVAVPGGHQPHHSRLYCTRPCGSRHPRQSRHYSPTHCGRPVRPALVADGAVRRALVSAAAARPALARAAVATRGRAGPPPAPRLPERLSPPEAEPAQPADPPRPPSPVSWCPPSSTWLVLGVQRPSLRVHIRSIACWRLATEGKTHRGPLKTMMPLA